MLGADAERFRWPMAQETGKAGRLSAMLRLRSLVLLLPILSGSVLAQAPSLTSAIGNQALTTAAGPVTIDLRQHFTYTGATGPFARFETVFGDFDVQLLPQSAPKHVENFTAYANDPPPAFEPVYFRNANGDLILDSAGNPRPIPIIYKKDEQGNRVLDAQGNPVTIPLDNPDTTNYEQVLDDAGNPVFQTIRVVRNYDQSFFHRAVAWKKNDAGQYENDPASPARVVQGGSFKLDQGKRAAIAQKNTVALEFKEPNGRGTLAAARGTGVDSAQGGWFFNVVDNSEFYTANMFGEYTVFGRVLGTGVEVLDEMAKVKRYVYSASFTDMPLRNYTSGPVTDDYLVLVHRVRVVDIQPEADGSKLGLLRYSVSSSSSGVVEASVVGSTLRLTPRAGGTATVTVTARDARNQVSSTFTVQVTQIGPVIRRAPSSQTVAPGGAVTFSVEATGTGALTYQWRKNGDPISGATGSSLTLSNLSSSDAGDYSVAVSDSTGTNVSASASLQIAVPEVGRLINLSVRSGSQPLIVGFVSSGSRSVLLRAAGPSLTHVGVTSPLADPRMTVHVDGVEVAGNDNWGGDAATLAPIFSSVGAFGWPNTASKDAALTTTVSGPATAVVRSADSTSGIVLAEVYALPGGGGRLVNVSGRGRVGTGADVLIAGFAISGNVPKKVLIRAVGPTLASRFNVSGALANPVLELHRPKDGGSELIAQNDDWGTDPEVVNGPTAGGFALDPGSQDSALLLTLSPGVYSALVRGFDNTVGEALVEVYEID
jgi:cyclophilin family peptidyl-prolyl cis-trans isomerase